MRPSNVCSRKRWTQVLSKLLESISIAIKDAMSISTVHSLAIQQTRREEPSVPLPRR